MREMLITSFLYQFWLVRSFRRLPDLRHDGSRRNFRLRLGGLRSCRFRCFLCRQALTLGCFLRRSILPCLFLCGSRSGNSTSVLLGNPLPFGRLRCGLLLPSLFLSRFCR